MLSIFDIGYQIVEILCENNPSLRHYPRSPTQIGGISMDIPQNQNRGISMEIPQKVPQRRNRGISRGISMEIPQNQNRGISRGISTGRSGHLCG
jgi:hypothetical protein